MLEDDNSTRAYLWRRVEIAELSFWDWRAFPFNLLYIPVSVDLDEQPFRLLDTSGSVIVFPHNAEVICAERRVDCNGSERRIEETIGAGAMLYVIGEFCSQTRLDDVAQEAERIAADWRMQPDIKRRFDTNRDGFLDGKELLALHRAAMDAARSRAGQAAQQGALHTISAPHDARRCVISSLTPEQLTSHYRGSVMLGLALMLLGVGGAAMLLFAHS